MEFEFAHCLAAVPAGSVVPGFRTPPDRRAFPKGLEFQTKPEIALEQIRQAMNRRFRWA